MRITRRDCEKAVERLAEIVGKTLVIEYSGAPQRPRLALYQPYISHRWPRKFVRWVSPRLPTGAFYRHVGAMIDGIELFLRDAEFPHT